MKEIELGYRPALDGLRGVSILAVMAYHAGISLAPGGFIGVEIFFVLSGFLITVLLATEWERTGAIRLKAFYVRRAFRLLPALTAVIAACCVYALIFQEPVKARTTYVAGLAAMFYAANWMLVSQGAAAMGALAHTWSLSIEEQFYLTWPVALRASLGWRVSRRVVLGTVVMLALASATYRGVLWYYGATIDQLCGLHTRADSLLFGCVAGLSWSWNAVATTGRARALRKAAAYAAIPLILAVVFRFSETSRPVYYGPLTLVSLATAALILETVEAPPGLLARALAFPILVWTGRISYGLYLWHFPVFQAIHPRFHAYGLSRPVIQLLRFALAFSAAAASFYLIERPFLRWKRRFEPMPAGC